MKREYRAVGADLVAEQTPEEFLGTLSRLPLQLQPGTAWEYGNSTDVLGHLLERLSGKTLERLLAERIFWPLRMRDTGFAVPVTRLGRLAEAFDVDPVLRVPIPLLDVRVPPARFSGGAGAVSTASDYLKFIEMLRNGGAVDRVQILSPKTVAYMTADHLGPLYAPSLQRGPRYLPGPGYGFGLGFAVRLDDGVAPLPYQAANHVA